MSAHIFISCIASVVSPTILIAAGAFISYKKWFDTHVVNQLSESILTAMLPLYIIFTIPKVYSRDDIWQVWPLLISPLIMVPTLFSLGYLCVKLSKFRKNNFFSLTSLYLFASIENVGILVVRSSCASFGPLANTENCDKITGYLLMMWLPSLIIVYFLILIGMRKDSEDYKDSFHSVYLQYFITPVPIAVMIGNIIGLIPGSNWFLYNKESIGFMFTDSALLIGYCGVMFSQIGVGSRIALNFKKTGKKNKKFLWVLVSRCLVVPGAVLVYVWIFWEFGMFYGDKVMAFVVYIGLTAQPTFLLVSIMRDFQVENEKVLNLMVWNYIVSPMVLVLAIFFFFLMIDEN